VYRPDHQGGAGQRDQTDLAQRRCVGSEHPQIQTGQQEYRRSRRVGRPGRRQGTGTFAGRQQALESKLALDQQQDGQRQSP
jgi:hypothetical protein